MPTQTDSHFLKEKDFAYRHALKLIELRDSLLESKKVKRNEVDSIFKSQNGWRNLNKGGHKHVEHQLTGIHIGYQAHDVVDIKKSQINEIIEQIQRHLEKLKVILNVSEYNKSVNYSEAVNNKSTLWHTGRHTSAKKGKGSKSTDNNLKNKPCDRTNESKSLASNMNGLFQNNKTNKRNAGKNANRTNKIHKHTMRRK